MRERERNIAFRRVRFRLSDKEPILLIQIPTGSQESSYGIANGRSTFDDVSYTRLNLKEIEKLNRFLDRCELAIAMKRRAK